MPSTLELCEKFYGTRDVYKIFSVAKDAAETELKKAYYKISLIVHPDRVEESEKQEATEKFKVLSKIYAILIDQNKRALYDDHGVIDDDDDSGFNWLQMWQQFFKPITVEDINNYQKEYVGSETERTDIKKSYLNGKGCLNYIMDHVQFMDCKDEPRIIGIIKEMIVNGEVPEYKICTEEPAVKRNRRHKKNAREAEEAAAIKLAEKKKNQQLSLEEQIAHRQTNRACNFAALLEKYSNCNDDEEDSIGFGEFASKTSIKKSKSKKTPTKLDTKPKTRKVLKGKVSKN